MQQHIEKWQHLSREEQKILAEVWGLVQNDDQEVHYEMLKLNAPDEASGEFWFRMAETLSTLPPNRSLDLRMNGGRLATAASTALPRLVVLSVLSAASSPCPDFC
nr:3-deoxy-manno-octulosonate cytidylyltransferase [Neisseria meningitidis]